MLQKGTTCFVIVNNRHVVPAEILNCSGGFYLVRLQGESGAIRLKKHRLFETEQEAQKALGIVPKDSKGYQSPQLH